MYLTQNIEINKGFLQPTTNVRQSGHCNIIIHTCTFFWISFAREFSMNSRSSSDICESSAGEFLTTRNQIMAQATPMEPVEKWNCKKANEKLHLFDLTSEQHK